MKTSIKHTIGRLLFAGIALLISPLIALPGIGAVASINASTSSSVTTQDAENDEELWCRSVACSDSSDYMNQPFAHGMTGLIDGDDGDFDKAILHVEDTSKVAGNTVNIPLYAGYGGAGVQGEGVRVGLEETSKMTTMQLQIGRFHHAIAATGISQDETMLGTGYDERVRQGLKYIHARKRNDDIWRRLIKRSSGRNLLFPPASTSLTRATLKSANVLDTAALTVSRTRLESNGAAPMALGARNSGGGRVRKYMIMATQLGLADVEQDPIFNDAIQNADVRGDMNAQFQGNFKDWRGLGIYKWVQQSHGNDGPQGSFAAPYGYLIGHHTTQATAAGGSVSQAVTNSSYVYIGSGTSATEGKTSGGSAITDATAPGNGAPLYTQYFTGAPWTYHNGLTEAAVTGPACYIMIIDAAGAGYGVFKVKYNNGNRFLLDDSAAVVSIGVGTEITTFTQGSLVVECNVLGVPFGRTLAFGAKMVVTGNGRINGSPASVGKRTTEVQEFGNRIGIGFENAWGCEVVERVDGTYPGFVMVEHATTREGAPVIT